MKTASLLVAIALCFAMAPARADSPPTLAVPNTSNAPPSGSPIEIESCTAGATGGLLVSQSDGNFDVAFTNEGAVTADLVRFQIDYGSERLFIRDVGHFSPGVTVTHIFRRRGGNVVSSPLFGGTNFKCTVAAAHFVNGSEWTPMASAPPQRLGDSSIGLEFAQTSAGVLVVLVLPASPAQEAGINKGDVITAIDGEQISTVDEAVALVSASPPGTVLTMTIRRGNRLQDLRATVPAHALVQNVAPQGPTPQTSPVASDAAIGEPIALPGGTGVDVSVAESVSSASANKGDTISIVVDKEVDADGWVLIPKGAFGQASISDVERAGGNGHGGKIALAIDWVYSADGGKVVLSAVNHTQGGGDQKGASSTATIATYVLLGPLGLFAHNFVRGRDVTIDTKQVLHVFVDHTVHVRASEHPVAASGFDN